MNKKVLFPVAGLAAAVVLYTGTSWWLGGKVEAQYEHYHAFLNKQAYLKVVKSEFHRGLFTSTSEWKVALSGTLAYSYRQALQTYGADAPPLELTVRETIHHGPFPGISSGSFATGRAIVDTEIVWPEQVKQALTSVFGDQAPLTIKTLVGWSGDGQMDISSPGFTKAIPNGEATIEWYGLKGKVNYAADYSNNKYEFLSEGLNATGKNGETLKVGKMTFTGDNHKAFEDLMIGKAGFEIAGINFANTKAPDQNVQIDKITYSADAKEAGEFLDVAVKLGVDKVSVKGKSYGPAHYDVSLNHLHGATLAKLSNALNEIQKQEIAPEQVQGMMIGVLMQHGIPLLKQTPEFKIDRISLQLPEGEAKIEAHAKINGFDGSEIQQPMSLLQKLDAGVDVVFPEKIARDIATKGIGAKMGLDNPADASAMVDQQIEGLIAQGFALRKSAC